jgi:hypothetical protein
MVHFGNIDTTGARTKFDVVRDPRVSYVLTKLRTFFLSAQTLREEVIQQKEASSLKTAGIETA